MDWDDLRYFLAIAKSGSLSGAARRLGVNHSTIFRRIQMFEERIGVRLFDRLPTGYALTVAGDEMLTSVEKVSIEIDAMNRRLTGRDLKLSGPLVITTTNTLAYWFLPSHLSAFRAEYPGIELELVLDTVSFNLSKRQADIAIRPTRNPPDTLVGSRLAELAFALYASKKYLKAQHKIDDLTGHTWIGFGDSLSHLAAAGWMRENLVGAPIALRANNLIGLLGAAKADMGVAPLPCFIGDLEPSLKRLLPPEPALASELWLLTHEDLRNSARVRAFMDFMAAAIIADKDILEGRNPA
ncbi:MAG: LysR family transcriptional regulator [Proteobacteria bacterium]|nr:LysR family transcriptional regulator [Pseudomonadota bacterium]